MSWIQKLYDTYECNQSQIGLVTEGIPLVPVFHTMVRAHIEVAIDSEGLIYNATLLSSDEDEIIIPCTEQSAGRTGSAAHEMPHPLSDKLQYLAGDYIQYGGNKKSGYEAYAHQLKEWAESAYANAKVKAIYSCIVRGNLIETLLPFGVLGCNENGKLESKWDKILYASAPKNIEQQDAVIRWVVDDGASLEDRCWLDQTMFDDWISFVHASDEVEGFCQVTGSMSRIARNHPKKIYNACANAKLISSNDGATYLGRFTDVDEAYGVSMEVSQKSHNALRWLIRKNNAYKDERSVTICWTKAQPSYLNVFTSSHDLMAELLNDEIPERDDDTGYTGEEVAKALRMKMNGYHSRHAIEGSVNIMTLESATDGRFSVTYYQEIDHQAFIDRLDKWHNTCCWIHRQYHTNYVGAPSPDAIADAVVGLVNNSSTKHVRQTTVNRILKCIVDASPLPLDIVQRAIDQTVKLMSYDNDLHKKGNAYKLNNVLSTTCALYNKFSIDHQKGAYQVALEHERTSRDYLFGRLLAIAQYAEQKALNASDADRMTNADRLTHRFSTHPFSTWKNIELAIKPYMGKLNSSGYFEKMMDEVMSLFNPVDFNNDKPLSGEFLLGYHCQRRELYTFNKQDEEE
jgi:CRISPR-associated protein Csd1